MINCKQVVCLLQEIPVLNVLVIEELIMEAANAKGHFICLPMTKISSHF